MVEGEGLPPANYRMALSPQRIATPNDFPRLAFCDGSVQMMSYEIDLLHVHNCLCNRHDGMAIDAKKL